MDELGRLETPAQRLGARAKAVVTVTFIGVMLFVAAIGTFVIKGGRVSFASIMFRSFLTVGVALVMVACTGMYRLGAGLQ
jgi:hypothetical protein